MKYILYADSQLLTKDLAVMDTFIKRFMGYMMRKAPHHEALLIKPCNSIHTFFMKFDIDVLFLDKDMKVLQKAEHLKKNKMIMPVKGAVMVVEARAGMLQGVEAGKQLKVKEAI